MARDRIAREGSEMGHNLYDRKKHNEDCPWSGKNADSESVGD